MTVVAKQGEKLEVHLTNGMVIDGKLEQDLHAHRNNKLKINGFTLPIDKVRQVIRIGGI